MPFAPLENLPRHHCPLAPRITNIISRVHSQFLARILEYEMNRIMLHINERPRSILSPNLFGPTNGRVDAMLGFQHGTIIVSYGLWDSGEDTLTPQWKKEGLS